MSEKRYQQAPFYLFYFFFGVGKSWTSPGIKNYFCQPIPFLEPKSSKSGKECNVLSAHVPCCLFVMVSFNQKDLYGKGQVYDRAQKRSVLSSFSGDLTLPQTLLCTTRMMFPFSPWFQSCFRSATDQPLDQSDSVVTDLSGNTKILWYYFRCPQVLQPSVLVLSKRNDVRFDQIQYFHLWTVSQG